MARTFTTILTVVIIAILVGILWIFARMVVPGEQAVTSAGNERDAPPIAIADEVAVGPTGLAIPVAGVKPAQLLDTYTQSTAGGAGGDNAIDIFAPEGTPVVAAAPGTVERLSSTEGGDGVTAYVRSLDGRQIYYYAHLQGYAPGLQERQSVERGQMIGRVGSTGNASPRAPHLHFAIKDVAPGQRWSQGKAVNPYPLLIGRNGGTGQSQEPSRPR